MSPVAVPAFEVLADALLGVTGSASEADARTALAEARAWFRQELSGDGPFAAIVANARIGAIGAEVLALLAAVERDDDRQRTVAAFRQDGTAHRVSVGIVRLLLGDAGARELAPDAPLLRSGLVRIDTGATWSTAEAAVEPSVLWALAGDGAPDERLPPLAGPIDVDVPESTDRADDPPRPDGPALILVVGPDEARRLHAAVEATGSGRLLVAPEPPTTAAQWLALTREATISGRSVLVQLDDTLPADGRRTIERADHLTWVLASRVELPVGDLPRRPWREIRPPASTATDDELRAAFGAADLPHRLTAHQVELASRVLAGGGTATEAVRRLASGELDRLAVRIRPRRTWDDLVLPHEQSAQVRDVVHRYRHRHQVYGPWGFAPLPSAGVVAMFAGPPGTGKTLSAEVVAGALGLDLFRIDLAALVSKYVGETEKNLERVFRAAEGGTMVLLFDEADAVFGKRSEVSDANDRYANVETSYLLQRLETYDGVVVLTTNYASNIDQAFLRRIHVSVEFPAPDEAERRMLWAKAFPADAPVDGLDIEFLAAQFKLTGAAIRSVSLGAAFRAAEAGTPITMTTIVAALHAELRKQGRLPGAMDFGRYGVLLDGPVTPATPRRRGGPSLRATA